MPSGDVVATPEWVAPYKVILYNDDGSVIGECAVNSEEEGQAFITSALTEALTADQEAAPTDADHG